MSASPTLTSPAALTSLGMLLGTAAYMSPEQARGKPVDRRADIFAFGAVLYEMLSGRRAFVGEDVGQTLAEVIKGEPDWQALPADLPASIRLVLTRCLQKDPRQRFRDIGAVRLALDGAFDLPASAAPPAIVQPSSFSRRLLPWIAGLVIGAAIAGAIAWSARPSLPARAVERFAITLPAGTELLPDPPAFSPDGRTLVFAALRDNVQHLYRRERERGDVVRIDGTEGGYYPAFSPDGQAVVFFTTNRQLKRVPLVGGTPVVLASMPGVGSVSTSWTDSRLAFAQRSDSGLREMAASGGEVRALTTLDASRGEVFHRFPQWLPGGEAVLFTVGYTKPVDAGWTEEIVVERPATHERRALTQGAYARYVPSGHIVIFRNGALWAAPFDLNRLELTGEPRPLNQIVPEGPGGAPGFAVGGDGTLVYSTGASVIAPRALAWVDRSGKEEPIKVPPRGYTYARLSPDGTRVALDARDAESDIWIWDLTRETLQRLTSNPGPDRSPVWSPDSTRVAYSTMLESREGIYWQPADGSGAPEPLIANGSPRFPMAFDHDGVRLLFSTPGSPPYDTGILTLGPDPRLEILLGDKLTTESNASLSPDGRWLAYESNESGRPDVYVRPFPNVGTSKQQVSNEGGTRPLWSRDGRELFYYAAPGRIMSVAVQAGERLGLGRPALVLEGSFAYPANTGRHYDVSLDGKRFLLLKDVVQSDNEAPQLNVVLNWFDELRRVTQ